MFRRGGRWWRRRWWWCYRWWPRRHLQIRENLHMNEWSRGIYFLCILLTSMSTLECTHTHLTYLLDDDESKGRRSSFFYLRARVCPTSHMKVDEKQEVTHLTSCFFSNLKRKDKINIICVVCCEWD